MGLLDANIATRLMPDYSRPVVQAYAEFTRAVIVAYGDISVIYSHGVGVLQPADWPSWVPDFRDMIANKARSSLRKGILRWKRSTGRIVLKRWNNTDLSRGIGGRT
jgi:hypothetical protein